MNKHFNMLFVGNSYTYFNDMPQIYFAKEAEKEGYDVTLTVITKGGAFLSQFADPEHEQGEILRQKIAGQHFDFVVLQDQSLNPILDEARFLKGVQGMKELINADHFVLYATWGRNVGCDKLTELGLTTEQMTEKLSMAYNKAARLYDMRVAEVGKAFLHYEPRDDLYIEDKSHPSAIGSAIAARVIFETIKSY